MKKGLTLDCVGPFLLAAPSATNYRAMRLFSWWRMRSYFGMIVVVEWIDIRGTPTKINDLELVFIR